MNEQAIRSFRNRSTAAFSKRMLVVICLASATSASAASIVVSGSGTFASDTASTAWSSPGGTYQFSFQMDNPPGLVNVGPFDFFAAFSDFSYSLNGNAVTTSPSGIEFLSTAAPDGAGMLLDDFDTVPNGLLILTGSDQMFTGALASPVMTFGTYTAQAGSDFAMGIGNSSSWGLTGTVTISAAPEPRTFYPLAFLFLAALPVSFRRARSL